MTERMKGFVFLYVLILVSSAVFAQTDSSELQKYTVETKYRPKLNDARKVDIYPESDDERPEPPVFTYDIPQFRYKVASVYRQSDAVNLKSDQPEPIPYSMIKLGFGNYTSPLAEIYLNSGRSEKYSYGARIKHLSAQGKPEHADFSHNGLGIYGKKESNNKRLSGKLDFDRNVFHFYGYPDTLKFEKGHVNQIINDIYGNVHFDNVPSRQKFGHATDLDFYYFSNLQGDEFDLKGSNLIAVNIKEGRLKFKTSVDYMQVNQDTGKFSRTFIELFPVYDFSFKKIDFNVGFRFTYLLDTQGGRAYPNGYLKAKHDIVKDKLRFEMGLDGGLKANTLKSLSNTNPFLNGRPVLDNTYEPYRVHASLTGALKNFMDFQLGISQSGLNKLPLYLLDSGQIPTFSVIYDDGSLFRFFGKLQFNVNDHLKIWVHGALMNYNMKVQDYAWQLPSFEASTGISYSVKEKWSFRFQTYAAGDRYQQLRTPIVKAKKLAPYVDLNLFVDYKFRPHLNFFAQVANISNGRYQQWYSYPVYGLNALAGVIYKL